MSARMAESPWLVTRPTRRPATEGCANRRLAMASSAGMAEMGNWPEMTRPNTATFCIPKAERAARRAGTSASATASTTTSSFATRARRFREAKGMPLCWAACTACSAYRAVSAGLILPLPLGPAKAAPHPTSTISAVTIAGSPLLGIFIVSFSCPRRAPVHRGPPACVVGLQGRLGTSGRPRDRPCAAAARAKARLASVVSVGMAAMGNSPDTTRPKTAASRMPRPTRSA